MGLVIATLGASATAQAEHQAFTVDTTLDFVDSMPGDGVCLGQPDDQQAEAGCSLRAAVMESNSHAGADTIAFDVPGDSPDQFVLYETGNNEDLAATGDLDIRESLTITGQGVEQTIVDGFREEVGANADRIFDIHTGTVLISGVTARAGQWTGNGGAVRNFDDLTVADSVVTESIAGEDGGGFYNHRQGVLTLQRVTVSENDALYGGGIYNNSDGPEPVEPTILQDDPGPGLTVRDSHILDNVADERCLLEIGCFGGNGGGIYNDDEALIVGSTIGGEIDVADELDTRNSADEDGGGIYNDIDDNPGRFGEQAELVVRNSTIGSNYADDEGGGIYNNAALAELENTSVDGNESDGDGGGIYNDTFFGEGLIIGTIDMTGGSVDENYSDDDGAGLYNDGEFNATGTSFSANLGDDEGGAIYNGGEAIDFAPLLTLSRAVVNLNQGDGGGGIYNEGPAVATVTDSTISGNFTNIEASGGGIWNGGIFRLERSTVSGNGYEDRPAPQPEVLHVANHNGGGIYNSGEDGIFIHEDAATRAVMTIVNSTISGNVANSLGGGIFNELGFSANQETVPPPRVILEHSTVTANNANANGNSIPDAGGGIFNEQAQEGAAGSGIVRTMNTIIAGNTAEEARVFTVQALVLSNCGGERPVSAGHNLEDADTCGLSASGDLKNTDPKLGPLAANGGPTQTHELLADSPAIDKAAGGASCPATDQRGTARPQGAGCDIGAYERLFQAPQPPAPAPPPPPAVTPPPPPPATVRPPTARPRTPRVIRRCRVPNVRGKTVRQARRAITRAGCRAAVMGRRYSVSYRPGRVIGQSVRPGARVRRGTLVRLVLSRGAQPVRPPFTG